MQNINDTSTRSSNIYFIPTEELSNIKKLSLHDIINRFGDTEYNVNYDENNINLTEKLIQYLNKINEYYPKTKSDNKHIIDYIFDLSNPDYIRMLKDVSNCAVKVAFNRERNLDRQNKVYPVEIFPTDYQKPRDLDRYWRNLQSNYKVTASNKKITSHDNLEQHQIDLRKNETRQLLKKLQYYLAFYGNQEFIDKMKSFPDSDLKSWINDIRNEDLQVHLIDFLLPNSSIFECRDHCNATGNGLLHSIPAGDLVNDGFTAAATNSSNTWKGFTNTFHIPTVIRDVASSILGSNKTLHRGGHGGGKSRRCRKGRKHSRRRRTTGRKSRKKQT